MNPSHKTQQQRESGKGLRTGVIVAAFFALLLAIILIITVVLSEHDPTFVDSRTTSFESVADDENTQISSYSIALDTSAYPGAIVEESSLSVALGTSVDMLPFATLDDMRFTGWYTGPEDDAAAVKIDNNSLDLLPLDVDQTLYARFEARPTTVDYDNPGLPILMYHYFYDPAQGEAGEDANWMDINLFQSHLEYMQTNDYYFPTWEEVAAYIRGEILLPERSIVLCSDDGHESFFRLAAPLVLDYEAKMTSFIVLIDLAPESLELYDPNKIFIQSHSYDMHRGGSDGDARILTASYQEVYDDAIMGKEILGNADAYCYPFGKTNENAKQALGDAGVGVALIIGNDRAYPLCDPMEVPRLRMSDGSTAEYLASVAY